MSVNYGLAGPFPVRSAWAHPSTVWSHHRARPAAVFKQWCLAWGMPLGFRAKVSTKR